MGAYVDLAFQRLVHTVYDKAQDLFRPFRNTADREGECAAMFAVLDTFAKDKDPGFVLATIGSMLSATMEREVTLEISCGPPEWPHKNPDPLPALDHKPGRCEICHQ